MRPRMQKQARQMSRCLPQRKARCCRCLHRVAPVQRAHGNDGGGSYPQKGTGAPAQHSCNLMQLTGQVRTLKPRVRPP